MKSNPVLFEEKYAAAVSLKNSWTRLASTIGSIKVVLHPDRLIVKPHWFAYWLIAPLRLDLNHEIPLMHIRDIRLTGRWLSWGKVEINFLAPGGYQNTLLLYLRGHREFMARTGKVEG